MKRFFVWLMLWLCLTSCGAPAGVEEGQNANAPATATPLKTVTINGAISTEEWNQAAVVNLTEGDYVSAWYLGADAQNIYVRVDGKAEWRTLGEVTLSLYTKTKRAGLKQTRINTDLKFEATNLTEFLLLTGNGYFGATYRVEANTWKASSVLTVVAVQGRVVEFSFPLKELEGFALGDVLQSVLVVSQRERLLQRAPSVEALRVKFTKP